MKRKRKDQEDAATVTLPGRRKREEAIDLTLSDEDDRTPVTDTAGHAAATTTILSSDDDNDDILFVKQASKLPHVESASLQASSALTTGTAGASSKTINDVLKDKNSKPSLPKSLPPLFLSTPQAVSTHTPCSLHYDILPPELAERLFLRMIDASRSWKKNKWYLNDRMVESTHKTCFYTSSNTSAEDEVEDKQWYMGRQATEDEQKMFPDEMEEARTIIEEFVNKELDKKTEKGHRYGMEFDGKWRGNVAASNCYRGGSETVGYHADQLTYLGPYPTIASLSLGTTRMFRLRGVPSLQDSSSATPASSNNETSIRTYDISLPHNSLCIMGAGTQEKFKHTIPPARSIDVFKIKNPDSGKVESYIERINITFRFYRPDFKSSTTPLCKCGIPSVLKADARGKVAANHSSNGTNIEGREGDASLDKNMRFFWMCFAGAQSESPKLSPLSNTAD